MIEIIIIGAGPTGLCAAKTFLQHDPNAEIVILDSHASVGGVWAKEQLYPTMKTNNLYTSLDFTDFPMDARFGIGPGEHVTGEAMHEYFTAYATHFKLLERIQFRTKVVEVRQQEDGHGSGWTLTAESAGGKKQTFECGKLIVATGVLSVPHMPSIKGLDSFSGPFVHSSEMGPQADALVRNPDVKTVAVLGGSKSSYDAVYLAATTGHKVEWIIRKSGRGPVWVFPPHTYLGPFKAWRERLITRRLFSFMSPCIWKDLSGFGWLRNLLHATRVGKFISQGFWGAIHADMLRDCGYRTDDKLRILEPEQNPFW
jgi:cation diffusion facilitator CzcD-associated flavoprotein CzcO